MKATYRTLLFILPLALWVATLRCQAAATTNPLPPKELLAKADEYRNFKGKSFTFDLRLRSLEGGEQDRVFGLKAEILNSHTSLITYTDPTSERGKALLTNENNMWFHSPQNSKPIRITPQQRLLGEASNGDVASTDFSGDYDPAYLREEVTDDGPCHVLELTAKTGSLATYNRMHLWISAKNHAPYKAEFYAPSGKLLKTAYYRRYVVLPDIGNKEQLVEIEIVNPFAEGKKTVMEYSNFGIVSLPVSRFSTTYLGTIR